MSGGVPAGERREQIADIIADHVSGPAVQDWDIQQVHRQDQLTAADKIAALFATPTPPIEGRDADVERVAIREYLIACADECDRQGSLYAQSGNVCAVPKLRAEAKAYRNAARMVDEQAHGSYRSAALQALGERG